MKIYLAADLSRREEMRGYWAELNRMGYEVLARYLTAELEFSDDRLPEARSDRAFGATVQRIAVGDLYDIDACDIFVLFTEAHPENLPNRGGRMVEFGYAVAAGKTVWIVGPDENVFCTLPRVLRFEGWDELLDELHMTAKL